MASSVTGSVLPSGSKVFTTIPDFLFIPEFVFSYIATLLYFIHCILSAFRWKSF
ncbi:mal, T cell differentiation protein b isoform X3 [Myxocyprinus asiaticus]|uniref:mal, T cell differentiation protein b isoform X3 n=1 Tax=Myxocyprinus asiaticus TaxID=70543 RepID=UPI0022239B6E|nr:mal, T cell differentiation protein b isoform X3 [Myxocyprinus asiaticus]